MYSLIREREWPTIVARELPTLGASLVIAELLYKFHSFTLETIAFLATWYFMGAGVDRATSWRRDRGSRSA